MHDVERRRRRRENLRVQAEAVMPASSNHFTILLLAKILCTEGHPACKKWGDGGGGHWLVRMEWRPAGWSVCLPLLIFPCTIKSRSSLLALAHPGGPGKRAVKRLWWWCLHTKNSGIVHVILPCSQRIGDLTVMKDKQFDTTAKNVSF